MITVPEPEVTSYPGDITVPGPEDPSCPGNIVVPGPEVSSYCALILNRLGHLFICLPGVGLMAGEWSCQSARTLILP